MGQNHRIRGMNRKWEHRKMRITFITFKTLSLNVITSFLDKPQSKSLQYLFIVFNIDLNLKEREKINWDMKRVNKKKSRKSISYILFTPRKSKVSISHWMWTPKQKKRRNANNFCGWRRFFRLCCDFLKEVYFFSCVLSFFGYFDFFFQYIFLKIFKKKK